MSIDSLLSSQGNHNRVDQLARDAILTVNSDVQQAQTDLAALEASILALTATFSTTDATAANAAAIELLTGRVANLEALASGAFIVAATTPVDGATDVLENQPLSITLSRIPQAGSYELRRTDTDALIQSFPVNKTNVTTLMIPDAPLPFNAGLYLIAVGVVDSFGNAITLEKGDLDFTTIDALPVNVPCLGQSNMAGNTVNNTGLDYDDNMFMWDPVAGAFVPAEFPLIHLSTQQAGDFGIPLGIALEIRRLFPTRRINLIGVASGGTGLATNDWNPGDPRYNEAVSRINAAMATRTNPQERIDFFAVQFGGRDAAAGVDTALAWRLFGPRMKAMVDQMRTDVLKASATTPFIFANAQSEAEDLANGKLPIVAYGRERINQVLAQADGFIDYAHCVLNTGYPGFATNEVTFDTLHFTPDVLLYIGEQFVSNWVANNFDPASVTVPGKPSLTVVFNQNDKPVITPIDPASNGGGAILEYIIKRNGAELTNSTTPKTDASPYTDETASPAAVYAYTVEVVNGAGVSVTSDPVTVTVPGSPPQFPVTDLIHRYALDADATDSVGAVDLTTSDVTFASDVDRGNVMTLGAAGYARFPENQPFGASPGPIPFTMLGWFKAPLRAEGTVRTLFGVRSANNGDIRLRVSVWDEANGQQSARTSVNTNNDLSEAIGALVPGEWNHVGVKYDPATGVSTILVNGVEASTFAGPLNLAFSIDAANPFAIGEYNLGTYGEGILCDDFAIWDRLLTTQEISDASAATS